MEEQKAELIGMIHNEIINWVNNANSRHDSEKLAMLIYDIVEKEFLKLNKPHVSVSVACENCKSYNNQHDCSECNNELDKFRATER